MHCKYTSTVTTQQERTTIKRKSPTSKGGRAEFAVAVEVLGVSAFFASVSLSAAPLRELNAAPTPD
jgi:hypothetical protein